MIDITVGPNVISSGPLVLSWHGLFSLIAVATAVYLVGRWAPTRGIDPDDIYSIAVWAIIGGIVGARLVHVVDNWSFYQANPGQVIAIWSGGIGLWGGILGGFITGALYALWRGHPVGIIADLTAPALLLVQTIGRLGDIVNGEHCARGLGLRSGVRVAASCVRRGPMRERHRRIGATRYRLRDDLEHALPDADLEAQEQAEAGRDALRAVPRPVLAGTLRHHVPSAGQGLGARNAGGPLHRPRRLGYLRSPAAYQGEANSGRGDSSPSSSASRPPHAGRAPPRPQLVLTSPARPQSSGTRTAARPSCTRPRTGL